MPGSTWSSVVGETLPCARQVCSCSEKGWSYSRTCAQKELTVCGDEILCPVTGGHRYSSDLDQGGMEIPCLLLFKGKPRH
jgi:hypothetical protein